MLRMAVVLAFVIACKGGEPSGSHTYHIKRDLKTDSTKTTGVGDATAGKPALSVIGGDERINAALEATLKKNVLAQKGAVTVKLTTDPATPKVPDGSLGITLEIHAVFAHSPDVSTLDATIKGTMTYDGANRDDLGHDLGEAVAGYLASEKLPKDVGVPTKPVAKAVSVTVGLANCSLHEDKSVRCWSLDFKPTLLPKLAGTRAVDAGNNFGSCGIRDNGHAYCIDAWDNTLGFADRDVCGADDATAISAGQEMACAIVAGGEVRCWGHAPKFFEPCGAGKAPKIKDVLGAVSLDVGPWDACAVLANGNVSCWKVGKEMTAKKLGGITKAKQVVVGFEVCALLDGDKIQCVSTPDKATKPHDVVLPEAPVQLAPGPDGVTCAVGTAGHVYCWNAGEGKSTIVDQLDGVRAIGGDLDGLCAVRTAGDVMCWGEMGEHKPPKPIRFPM